MREDRLIVGRSIADAGESMTLRLDGIGTMTCVIERPQKSIASRLSATHLKYKEIKISSTSQTPVDDASVPPPLDRFF